MPVYTSKLSKSDNGTLGRPDGVWQSQGSLIDHKIKAMGGKPHEPGLIRTLTAWLNRTQIMVQATESSKLNPLFFFFFLISSDTKVDSFRFYRRFEGRYQKGKDNLFMGEMLNKWKLIRSSCSLFSQTSVLTWGRDAPTWVFLNADWCRYSNDFIMRFDIISIR